MHFCRIIQSLVVMQVDKLQCSRITCADVNMESESTDPTKSMPVLASTFSISDQKTPLFQGNPVSNHDDQSPSRVPNV